MSALFNVLLCLFLTTASLARASTSVSSGTLVDGTWTSFGDAKCSAAAATVTYSCKITAQPTNAGQTDANIYISITGQGGLTTSEHLLSAGFTSTTAQTITLSNTEDVGAANMIHIRTDSATGWDWQSIAIKRGSDTAVSFFYADLDDHIDGIGQSGPYISVCAEPVAPIGFNINCLGTIYGHSHGCFIECQAGLLTGVPRQIQCAEDGTWPELNFLNYQINCITRGSVSYVINSTTDDTTTGSLFITLVGSAGTTSEFPLPLGKHIGSETATISTDDVGTLQRIILRTNSQDSFHATALIVAKGPIVSSFLMGSARLAGGSNMGELIGFCTIPTAPAGVTMRCESTAYGDYNAANLGYSQPLSSGCHFSCPVGYSLAGQSSIICSSDGVGFGWPDFSTTSCQTVLIAYNLTVITGVAANAGSKSHFFFSFQGVRGTTSEVEVFPPGNTFSAGSTNKFTVYLEDVGKLTLIKARHNDNDGWLPRSFIVVTPDGTQYVAYGGFNWIDGDDNDLRGNPDEMSYCFSPLSDLQLQDPNVAVSCETTAMTFNDEIQEGCMISCNPGYLYTSGPVVLYCDESGTYAQRGGSGSIKCVATNSVPYQVYFQVADTTSDSLEISFVGTAGISSWTQLAAQGTASIINTTITAEDVGDLLGIRIQIGYTANNAWRSTVGIVTKNGVQYQFPSDAGDSLQDVSRFTTACAEPNTDSLNPLVQMRCLSVAFEHGSGCHFFCPVGYSLNGPDSTICSVDSTWTDFSTTECVPLIEPLVKYSVSVQTYIGVGNSQTGGNVYITFIGGNGHSTSETFLRKGFPTGVQTVTVNAENLNGDVEGIRVFLDSDDGWIWQTITVTQNGQVSTFYNQKWLDGNGASVDTIVDTWNYCRQPPQPSVGSGDVAPQVVCVSTGVGHFGCYYTCPTDQQYIYTGPIGTTCESNSETTVGWVPYGQVGTAILPTCSLATNTMSYSFYFNVTANDNKCTIYVSVFGSNGISPEIIMGTSGLATGTITKTLPDVGKVTAVRIRRYATTTWGSQWRMASLTLTDSNNNQYTFTADAGDGLNPPDKVMMTYCAEFSQPASAEGLRCTSTAYYFGSGCNLVCNTGDIVTGGPGYSYCQNDGSWSPATVTQAVCTTPSSSGVTVSISVTTANTGNANSRANFYMSLIGTSGRSGEVNITPKGGSYSNGQTATFAPTIPDIGDRILAVSPRMDDNDGWLIRQIQVVYKGQTTMYYAGFDWLDGDDNDRRGNPDVKNFCAAPDQPAAATNLVITCDSTAIPTNKEISEGCYFTCNSGYLYTSGPISEYCTSPGVYTPTLGTGLPTCTAASQVTYSYSILAADATKDSLSISLVGSKGIAAWTKFLDTVPKTLITNTFTSEDVGTIYGFKLAVGLEVDDTLRLSSFNITDPQGNVYHFKSDDGDTIDETTQYQVECAIPSNLPPGVLIRCSSTHWQSGSGCHLFCASGQRLVGPDTLTCGVNSRWEQDYSNAHCEAQALTATYNITVETYQGKGNAQTNNDVYITIIGPKGDTGEMLLSHGFPQGVTSGISLNGVDVGQIRQIRLFLNGTDGWMPQNVTIWQIPYGDTTPTYISSFSSQEWLDGNGASTKEISETLNYCAQPTVTNGNTIQFTCPSTAVGYYGCYATCIQDGYVYNGPVGLQCQPDVGSTVFDQPGALTGSWAAAFGYTAKAATDGSMTCTPAQTYSYTFTVNVATNNPNGVNFYYSFIGTSGVSKQRLVPGVGTAKGSATYSLTSEDVGELLAMRMRVDASPHWEPVLQFLGVMTLVRSTDGAVFTFMADNGDGFNAENEQAYTFCVAPVNVTLQPFVTMSYTSTAYYFGSGFHLQCPIGQVVVGEPQSRCQRDGTIAPPLTNVSCVISSAGAQFEVTLVVTEPTLNEVYIAIWGLYGMTAETKIADGLPVGNTSVSILSRDVGPVNRIMLYVNGTDNFRASLVTVTNNGTTTYHYMGRYDYLARDGILGETAYLCAAPSEPPVGALQWRCISTVTGNPDGCYVDCGPNKLIVSNADHVTCNADGDWEGFSEGSVCAAAPGLTNYTFNAVLNNATLNPIYISFAGTLGESTEKLLTNGWQQGSPSVVVTAEQVGILQRIRIRVDGVDGVIFQSISIQDSSVPNSNYTFLWVFVEGDNVNSHQVDACAIPNTPTGSNVILSCGSTSSSQIEGTGCELLCQPGNVLQGPPSIQCHVGRDECAGPQAQTCNKNANCFTYGDNVVCQCKAGYTGDGTTSCTDINECAGSTPVCNANAQCTNTNGSFTCTCNPPYVGNGVNCQIPAPPSPTPCGQCTGGRTCDENTGQCHCPKGYNDTGTCVDINECTDGTATCPAGQCINTAGSYTCSSGSSSSSSLSGGAIAGIVIAVIVVVLIIAAVIVGRRKKSGVYVANPSGGTKEDHDTTGGNPVFTEDEETADNVFDDDY